jgi:hypothetical protein
MTIGFALSAPDNDSYMLSDEGAYPACPTCGLATDRTWIDPEFRPAVGRFDASYTYDGYLIVSERLRSVAESPQARFISLPSAPGFYSLVIEAVVPFDVERRNTVFEKPCATCGRFYAVAGATPVFLKLEDPVPDELFRTDVEFGTGNEQCPIPVLGQGLAERLRSANLAGVELLPARGLPAR